MAYSTNWIDIARYQGILTDAQWKDVKSKCEGVVFRIAYRGYSAGNIKMDNCFTENFRKAAEYGLKRSVYFFTQAITEAEAIEEADYVENTIGVNATRTACIKAFCERVIALGGVPGIYASTSWFKEKLNMSSLKNYKLWVADYRGYNGYDSANCVMWQFSSSNAFGITGFNKSLDCNYNYEDFNGENTDNSGSSSSDTNTDTGITSSEAGTKVEMNDAILYSSSTATTGTKKNNFTVYIYDGKVINNRLRVTTMKSKCGKGMKYVTGWIDKSILRAEIYAGRQVFLNNQYLYSSSTSTKGYLKHTYTCYIYDAKEYNGRYRVCRTATQVGKGMGYVVGWVDKSILI